MTCVWTSSIRAWHAMHVPATLSTWMLERASVCGRMKCDVWQDVHTAVTDSPRSNRPAPWMDRE